MAHNELVRCRSTLMELFALMCDGCWPKLLAEPGRVDLIFVWGRAQGEWDQVLKLTAELHHKTGARILIPGYVGADHGQGSTGYPGPRVWREMLVSLGVPSTTIFETSGIGHNTKTEYEDALDWMAKEGNVKTIFAVTTALHACRAMLGATCSHDVRGPEYWEMKVFPCFPLYINFNENVWGSQGEGPFSYNEWVKKEFDRIPIYQEKGDLAFFKNLCARLMMQIEWLDESYETVSVELLKRLANCYGWNPWY